MAQNEYDKLLICHDYFGIVAWVQGDWEAKSTVAIDYLKLLSDYIISFVLINKDITFVC